MCCDLIIHWFDDSLVSTFISWRNSLQLRTQPHTCTKTLGKTNICEEQLAETNFSIPINSFVSIVRECVRTRSRPKETLYTSRLKKQTWLLFPRWGGKEEELASKHVHIYTRLRGVCVYARVYFSGPRYLRLQCGQIYAHITQGTRRSESLGGDKGPCLA